ncbi:uncharacterized protein LOC103710188 isoform X2 [Phoenix dactylifera]|uniref:Uncharacterized protein LOC103710188 isoform X2 n=1 Tax=Phoenix dactylifera TaxID=42345 RepID=A0A8B7C8N7_PHODC|nr:uncharacterized protein LOC103710188 isoform X2 [Phoenix dactylifera]
MATGLEQRPIEEDEEEEALVEEKREEEEEAPSHLPLAPSSSELFDVSTTVDPSYIISLIRRLLPSNSSVEKQCQGGDDKDSSVQASEMNYLEQNLRNKLTATQVLEDLVSDKSLADSHEGKLDDRIISPENSLASSKGNGMNHEFGKEERSRGFDDGQSGVAETKDPWEDCGCTLWDLSASRTQAEFMEICLGIIGNLACHEVLSNAIVSTSGLIETVVEQLFLDDSACLSETFRLLAAGLQGSGSISWAEALLHDQILLRVLWIVGNTLNPTLLEKSIEFLLAIIDTQEVATILIQPLMKLGLPELVVSLLACEINKSGDDSKLERSSILDLVLRLVETLSVINNCSQVISSNEELFHLVCRVVKLPDKFEAASTCVSAVVVIANLLVDMQHLISELSHDFLFLQGLLDILPLVSYDLQARNALWCILARLLAHIQESDISISTLRQFVSLFLEKSYLIEEDLEGHPMDNLVEDLENSNAHKKSGATATSIRRIASLIEKWMAEKPSVLEKDVAGTDDDDGKAHRLLNCCQKYGL